MTEAKGFEAIRDEIVRAVWLDVETVDADHVRVCLDCGALVPRYACATHLKWHEGG